METLIANLGAVAPKPWECVSFDTTGPSGEMLVARPGVLPPAFTVEPRIDGWQRIFVGLHTPEPEKSFASLRLSADPAPRAFKPCKQKPSGYWQDNELIEEGFWKCADMTGQTISFQKPEGRKYDYFALAYLRFESMTDEEVAAYVADRARRDVKKMHAHVDMDWAYTCPKTMDEYCQPIEAFLESDAEIASVEIYYTLAGYENARSDAEPVLFEEFHTRALREITRRQAEIFPEYARRAHAGGLKLYAAHRMSLAAFAFPADSATVSDVLFVREHPEFWCVDRDGERFPMASIAFPETRKILIDSFLTMAGYGFDGATMILHRGVLTLWEKPICDYVSEKWPGTDARTLEISDPRLIEARCHYSTLFVRELRAAFDEFAKRNGRERLGINAIVEYTPRDNLLIGLDVEAWMREGLITSVVPANMRVWETVEPKDYVDAKRHAMRAPVKRHFWNDLDTMLAFYPEWTRMARESGCKVYFETQWENTVPPAEYADYIKALRARGADRFSMWDTYPGRSMYLPEWEVIRRAGHAGDPLDTHRVLHRVTRLGAVPMGSYHPSWRG